MVLVVVEEVFEESGSIGEGEELESPVFCRACDARGVAYGGVELCAEGGGLGLEGVDGLDWVFGACAEVVQLLKDLAAGHGLGHLKAEVIGDCGEEAGDVTRAPSGEVCE